MRIDYANIYDLPKELFAEIVKDRGIECNKKYWEDLSLEAKEFAKNILNDIQTKELPYTMSIDGSFGSGKTYFMTRFCQHIKDEGIKAAYISATRFDYRSDPMLCITKQIYDTLDGTDKVKELKKFCKKLLKFSFGTLLPKFFTVIDIKGLETLFEKSDKDHVQEFKKYISEQIQKTSAKRMVLIIDELDRCRPDFAISLIETLKHFFNIDGLFVILPINSEFLTKSLKSVYGPDFCNNDTGEPYTNKLVDNSIRMYIPSEQEYTNITKGFLKEIPEDKLIPFLEPTEVYNLANIFRAYNLSLRQSKNICDEIVGYYKSGKASDIVLFTNLACRKILNKDDTEYTQAYRLASSESDDRQQLLNRCNGNYEEQKRGLFLLLLKYGIICSKSYIDVYYGQVLNRVISCAKYLFKNEDIAAQFAESYLYELFQNIKKLLNT